MRQKPAAAEHRVPKELHGQALDRAVRVIAGLAWNDARRMVRTGKVTLGGEVVTDVGRHVRSGDKLALNENAPRPKVARVREVEDRLFVHLDPAVVVVRKPAGISTVPFGDEPHDEMTLDALVREALARRDSIRGRAPLGVVQRLDKGTTGLLVFTRTVAAKKHLSQQLRVHSVLRRYLAIAHGVVHEQTIRSHLVDDRGDGLRGSARGRREGQLAVTHVEPIESLKGATLIACRLETGRTHQIRIHLAESGHPLLGENVYIRSFRGPIIPAPRVMLHAFELGFEHPTTGEMVHFEDGPPPDFEETLARLR